MFLPTVDKWFKKYRNFEQRLVYICWYYLVINVFNLGTKGCFFMGLLAREKHHWQLLVLVQLVLAFSLSMGLRSLVNTMENPSKHYEKFLILPNKLLLLWLAMFFVGRNTVIIFLFSYMNYFIWFNSIWVLCYFSDFLPGNTLYWMEE